MRHELELTWLLERIQRSESLVRRLEAFYAERSPGWSPGLCSQFLDQMERKKDQIDYEKHRAHKLGFIIATGRLPTRDDF
jgi:hypothetical protein